MGGGSGSAGSVGGVDASLSGEVQSGFTFDTNMKSTTGVGGVDSTNSGTGADVAGGSDGAVNPEFSVMKLVKSFFGKYVGA